MLLLFFFFFFNDTATTEIYPLSLHDALPISPLTTVSQVDPIYAEFPISEQRALAVFRRWDADPRAPRDIELELILADGSGYPTRGRAAALDRQGYATDGTGLARGVISEPRNVLRTSARA